MNELDLERLEDYLNGQLPVEEQLRLKERLAVETQLQEQLQWLEDVRQVAIGEEEVRLKRLLQRSRQQSVKVFKLEKWVYAIAATVVLLMVASIWWFNRPVEQDLFAANFQPYPNVSVPIERAQPTDNLKLRAFQSYEGENYALAVTQMDSLFQLEIKDSYRFYYGNALLATGQYQAAADEFLQLSLAPANEFSEQTEWYLALSYLKLGNEEIARNLFKKISETEGHVFQARARQLMNGLH